jgi:hypothetical protein
MRALAALVGLGLALAAGDAPAQGHAQGHRGHDHHAPASSPSDSPATREYKAAHAQMMRDMALPYSGDPDVDFRMQMIPHHQGAIAMARVALERAKDPWTRQLAEAVIVEQQREIAEMEAWLTKRGIAPPANAGASHVQGANSFRSRSAEAGSRSEAVGQSWAPGGGVR